MSVPWVAVFPAGLLAGCYFVALVWSVETLDKDWRPAAILWGPLVVGFVGLFGALVLTGLGVRLS